MLKNPLPRISQKALLLLLVLPWSPLASGFTSDAFECYGAVYSNDTEPPTLINGSLRVGLHPQGNDPVMHIYTDQLSIFSLKSLRISDRFMRGRILSKKPQNQDIGGFLLRQKGLNLSFDLAQKRRTLSQAPFDLSFRGECSSVGYQQG